MNRFELAAKTLAKYLIECDQSLKLVRNVNHKQGFVSYSMIHHRLNTASENPSIGKANLPPVFTLSPWYRITLSSPRRKRPSVRVRGEVKRKFLIWKRRVYYEVVDENDVEWKENT